MHEESTANDGHMEATEAYLEPSGDTGEAAKHLGSIGPGATAVVIEMEGHYARYKAGEISGQEYERLLCDAYRRHDFPNPERLGYTYPQEWQP